MTTTTDYKVGDIIRYRTFMGRLVTVRVTGRFDRVNDDVPGLPDPASTGSRLVPSAATSESAGATTTRSWAPDGPLRS